MERANESLGFKEEEEKNESGVFLRSEYAKKDF